MSSTINTAIPVSGSSLTSAPIRANFQAAANDINNILGMYAGTSLPGSPVTYQLFADTTGTPNVAITIYDGTQAVTIGTLNLTTHAWTPSVGASFTLNGNTLTAASGSATITVPASTDTLVNNNGVAILTNKTLTSPTINTPTLNGAGGQLTLPAGPDTLVARASTDTLTNKTFDTAGTGNSLSINGVAVTANSGTGAVARAVSPSFTTPTLGVAAATSVNKMAITAPASGSTLAVADGKTATVSNSLTLAGTDGTTLTFQATGTVVNRDSTDTLSNKTLSAAILGTPTSGTLTNCTGLPSAGVTTGTSGAVIGLLNGNWTRSGTELNTAQPAVSVVLNSNTSNDKTGDGTAFTVPFDSEIFDQANNYANPTFTAPLTGRYFVNVSVMLAGLGSAHTACRVSIITSARSYFFDCNPFALVNLTTNLASVWGHAFVDMAASATMTVTVTVSGGTKTVGLSSGVNSTALGVHLVC